MLFERPQHGVWPVLHDGKAVSQAYLGTRPHAIREAMTTPIGWNVDRAHSKKRRLVGRNSSVMVASIGMLPPTPRPMQNVRKQRAPKLLGAAKLEVKNRQLMQRASREKRETHMRPNTEEMRHCSGRP